MPKIIYDKKIKKGDCEFLFSGNTIACKWMDNQLVLLLSSAIEGMNDILSIQRREKSSKTKSLVLCPKVVKFYNSNIGGVDLMTSVLLHNVWIESHLLDLTSTFFLI